MTGPWSQVPRRTRAEVRVILRPIVRAKVRVMRGRRAAKTRPAFQGSTPRTVLATLRASASPSVAPNTAARYVATYLQHPTIAPDGGQRFFLAGLRHTAGHVAAGAGTEAWYVATYLPHPTASATPRTLTL